MKKTRLSKIINENNNLRPKLDETKSSDYTVIKDLLEEESRGSDKVRNSNQRLFQTIEISTILGSKSFKVNKSADDNINSRIEDIDDNILEEEKQQIKNEGVISKLNSPEREKKVNYRRTKYILSIILLTFISISGALFMLKYGSDDKKIKNEDYLTIKPVDEKDTKLLMVKVKDNNLDEVSSIITQKQVINDQKSFKKYLTENKVKVDKGVYYLSKSMTFKQICDVLKNNNKTYSFNTTVENTLEQTANKLQNDLNIKTFSEDFLKLASSKAFIEKLQAMDSEHFKVDEMTKSGIKYFIQGYFLNDKYTFSFNKSIEDNLYDWFKQINSKLKSLSNDLMKVDLSVHKVITLASSLDAESHGNKKQYTDLAGVYMNRYNEGLFLGIDSFNKYGYKQSDNHDEKKLKDEEFIKKFNSKYNTYTSSAFPIGAISNASIEEIRAICNYLKHPYKFYFLANTGDQKGKLVFSQTIEGYKIRKAKYLK